MRPEREPVEGERKKKLLVKNTFGILLTVRTNNFRKLVACFSEHWEIKAICENRGGSGEVGKNKVFDNNDCNTYGEMAPSKYFDFETFIKWVIRSCHFFCLSYFLDGQKLCWSSFEELI